MYLNQSEIEHVRLKRKFIDDNFDKINKIFCMECKGTGLQNVYYHSDGSKSWTGEFCENCKGLGYIFLNISDELFVKCKRCEGTGFYDKLVCKKCKGVGLIDWLENLFDDWNL